MHCGDECVGVLLLVRTSPVKTGETNGKTTGGWGRGVVDTKSSYMVGTYWVRTETLIGVGTRTI